MGGASVGQRGGEEWRGRERGRSLRPQSLPLVTATEEREGPSMPSLLERERETERESEDK